MNLRNKSAPQVQGCRIPTPRGGKSYCSAETDHPRFEILGVKTHAVQISDVVFQMQEWIRNRRESHLGAPTDMHCIVEAQHDPEFLDVLNSMDLVVPDGMPLVWLGRRLGHLLPRRVYGPDLMLEFCEKTAKCGYRHFFYGAGPGVPERMAQSLK